MHSRRAPRFGLFFVGRALTIYGYAFPRDMSATLFVAIRENIMHHKKSCTPGQPQAPTARSAAARLNAILKSFNSPLGAHHTPWFLRADAIERCLWPIHGDVHRGIGIV